MKSTTNTFPKLYKKTSTGAIQEWSINVYRESLNSDATTVETTFGQLDSDKIQSTKDVIYEGKNAGKKNETTPYQQAEAEAQSKWQKQLKKGYVESIKGAQKGELDSIIEGGILPMLAHKFSEQGHKIKYPAYVQPKLDGIRCIAMIKKGKCTLWSRTRKQITSMPHIVRELEKLYPSVDHIFDGELYNHEYKSNFEKIVSMVRQDEPDAEHEIVQYHVYDFADDINATFANRASKLRHMKDTPMNREIIIDVDTALVNNEDEAVLLFDEFRSEGYEGAMIRNMASKYANKRSYDLQKIKEFDDAEFKIVDVEEGRGKLAGHAIFVCETETGETFNAKLKGDTEKLKVYFENKECFLGKFLTVQYQGLTGKQKVPRFPVGLRIRDIEDM